jgi:hypothetical protein
VVTDTREVLDTASADEHDGVLLEVVALARDVCIDLLGVGKTYAGHLTHSGIRLLRRGGVHTQTYAPLLRTCIQRARLRLHFDNLASFAN